MADRRAADDGTAADDAASSLLPSSAPAGAAGASGAAERARIEASGEEDLRAELSMRGILPARGAPLAELLALRLAAPDPTPEALQASRERARYALAMSACRHCDKAFADPPVSADVTGRCSGCKRVRYCDVKCQKGDWLRHKPECKTWRAEADAAIVAAGGCPLGDLAAQGAAVMKWMVTGRSLAAIRAAAEGGDLSAQSAIGMLALRHVDTSPTKVSEEVAAFVRRSAAGNVAHAQSALGFLYLKGLGGLAVDAHEAARLFGLAASQGLPDAQYNLNICYRDGVGVPVDLVESARLMRLSAEQGHAEAQANLSAFYTDGHGVAVDYAEAMRWALLAADQGSSNGEYNVANLHHHGLGVPPNLRIAAAWYTRAAREARVQPW
jgi:TPR repeat protein